MYPNKQQWCKEVQVSIQICKKKKRSCSYEVLKISNQEEEEEEGYIVGLRQQNKICNI